MRRWTKGCLIFAAIIFAVGIGCLLVAFGMGVPSQQAKSTVEKYVNYFDFFGVFRDSDWLDELDSMSDIDDIDDIKEYFNNNHGNDMDEANVYEYSVSDVDSLEMEFKKADVRILPAETEDKITVKVDKASVSRFKEKCKNKTLELEYTTSRTNKHTAGVEIYLPQGVQWKKAELQLGAGTIDIQNPAGLYADSIELEIGGGVLYADYIQGKKLDVELGAGQMELDYVDMENIDIEVAAGEAKVCLAGTKELYQSEIEVAAGEVKYGDETYSGLVNERKNHPKDAVKKISVQCAAGEVKITFKEEI